jgi:hypothetical protein
MTYQAIPSRELIRKFKAVMENLIQKSDSLSFSYKGEIFKITKEEKKTPMSRMLEKLKANAAKRKVETKEEIYSNKYE